MNSPNRQKLDLKSFINNGTGVCIEAYLPVITVYPLSSPTAVLYKGHFELLVSLSIVLTSLIFPAFGYFLSVSCLKSVLTEKKLGTFGIDKRRYLKRN